MGLMHKLLKHKNLKMDLSSTSHERLIGKEPTNSEDKHFTTEHILQLCKFLAEKSKRNKNIYKQQQSPRKLKQHLEYHNNSFEYEEISDSEDLETTIIRQEKRLPCMDMDIKGEDYTIPVHAAKIPTTTKSHILSDNLDHHFQAVTNTPCNTSQSSDSANQTPNHNDEQNPGKRDILIKIRQQIFERKRQRHLAHLQQRLNVWRPW
ncbi:uncharacterized protein LOC119673650 [Teleopsis dalmanni]|uniref:uncharacterized protein LOC119673650 n=1 Tax=Teleopsis dalmanni TaxID=139649 RepID=UPI0018CFE66F|nr:uncharacterized protein LOC119673650 [Teleopsis dalmanni]